jgi:hypothetical protein
MSPIAAKLTKGRDKMTKKIIIVVVMSLILLTSCRPATDNEEVSRLKQRIKELEDQLDAMEHEQKEREGNLKVGKVRDYFPLEVGSRWIYVGYGNEYAQYNEEIMYSQDKSYQSIVENPGTNLVKVYTEGEEEIRITYEQGEVYDRTNVLEQQSNVNHIVLQGPVSVGTSWQNDGYDYEITTTNMSMKLENKIYKDIIEVKITPRDRNNKTEMYRYYAKGVGLVRLVYIDGESRIESVLREYKERGSTLP